MRLIFVFLIVGAVGALFVWGLLQGFLWLVRRRARAKKRLIFVGPRVRFFIDGQPVEYTSVVEYEERVDAVTPIDACVVKCGEEVPK
jgi:uncharacterized protein (TIGR03382 family)